jgi:hypothetical protein
MSDPESIDPLPIEPLHLSVAIPLEDDCEQARWSAASWALAEVLGDSWPVVDDSRSYDLAQLDAGEMVGFHEVESFKGKQFRWSAPEAMLNVPLPPGIYEVSLDALPLRPDDAPLGLDVFLDRRHVASFPRGVANSPLVFRVDRESFDPSTAEHRLIFLSEPWKTVDKIHGRRVLGLPLCGVRFTPVHPPQARTAPAVRADARARATG